MLQVSTAAATGWPERCVCYRCRPRLQPGGPSGAYVSGVNRGCKRTARAVLARQACRKVFLRLQHAARAVRICCKCIYGCSGCSMRPDGAAAACSCVVMRCRVLGDFHFLGRLSQVMAFAAGPSRQACSGKFVVWGFTFFNPFGFGSSIMITSIKHFLYC